MNPSIRAWRLQAVILLAAAVSCSAALAQRRNIPVADLIDVPVTLATPKAKTVDQVRAAIIAASLAYDVDLEPIGDNAFKVSLVREFDSWVVMNITYSATKYSVTYVSSENLSYNQLGEFRNTTGANSPENQLKEWRKARSAKLPEFPFIVDRLPTIHPAYEQYLFEFSAAVRRQLKWAQ